MKKLERTLNAFDSCLTRSAEGLSGGSPRLKAGNPIGNMRFEKAPEDAGTISPEMAEIIIAINFLEPFQHPDPKKHNWRYFSAVPENLDTPLDRDVLDAILDEAPTLILAMVQGKAARTARRHNHKLRDAATDRKSKGRPAVSVTALEIAGQCMQRVYKKLYEDRDKLLEPIGPDERAPTYRDIQKILNYYSFTVPKLMLTDIPKDDYPMGIPPELFQIWRRCKARQEEAERRGEDPWKEAQDWLLARKRPKFTEDEAKVLKVPPAWMSINEDGADEAEDVATGLDRVDAELAAEIDAPGGAISIDHLPGEEALIEQVRRWEETAMLYFCDSVRPIFRLVQKIERLSADLGTASEAESGNTEAQASRADIELDLKLHELELAYQSSASNPKKERKDFLDEEGLPNEYFQRMSNIYSDSKGLTGDRLPRFIKQLERDGMATILADHGTSISELCQAIDAPPNIEHQLRVRWTKG
ncbi:hypothetical protein JQT66_16925 [Sulfitobacter mediterraneus]|uniref:hypothetical protein n=1 Tax=Sulfitobacter mediterraneus TaxID=83219 RepID=UPI00193121D1|nr:hypothetical protein [Sulfitobacter mediterraneus]MBM1311925.1 hypothetical protein [Sulfitobacter mediterraneus]MBM1315806.1 hypothetical protein [Sulfitobacter mediterraneus]MBM1324168.1 hypothetical protein [Sulfitobacter mediterraneus]MBM1328080.1 hypothetical protein [Sulfitobacter mediterraneus]MBM1399428.1 hypothetical protein [Sulfitobacter mediterraneus]